MSNTDNLEELLNNKVASVTISHSSKRNQKIIALKMDQIRQDEISSIPISIKKHNKKDKWICDYLGMHSWPSCDYLHINISESKKDEMNLYLIEQSDIEATFIDKMNNPDHIKMPMSTKLIDKFIQELESISSHDKIKIKSIENKLLAELVIHNLAQELMRKFFASIGIIFRLQMEKDFAEHFPDNQVFHLVVFDIPKNKKELHDFASANSMRMLGLKTNECVAKVCAQIKKPVGGLNISKDQEKIKFGEVIYGFGDLIDSIDEHKQH